MLDIINFVPSIKRFYYVKDKYMEITNEVIFTNDFYDEYVGIIDGEIRAYDLSCGEINRLYVPSIGHITLYEEHLALKLDINREKSEYYKSNINGGNNYVK